MTLQAGLGAEPVNLNAIVADQAAFRDWYEQALPRVYRYLLARSGGDADLAEELTQQTFVAGAPNPAAPSMNAPNENATRTAWSRRSPESRAIDAFITSNWPVATAMS